MDPNSNCNYSPVYILGLGNPIIDISASTDSDSIQKFGVEWGRTIFANSSNIGFYDHLEAQNDVTYIPGGSVTNSIRIASVRIVLYLLVAT
jgi:adenosine kinase